MDWVESLVNAHKEFESPLSFWRWAGLAAISATVKDNVWMNRGTLYNLYPNIYVMFHADSGLKKGPPVNVAKRLVKIVNNTRIISGRSSIQGILKELATSQSQPGGYVLKKAVAFICSSELSSSIVEDKVANTILTDLYDRSYNVGEWRSLLKMESFDLKDPTITMLTATNEAHSSSFFDRKDIRGGYFARTFIIYESEENRSNSLLIPPRNPINYEQFASYLKCLAKLNGEFKPIGWYDETDDCKIQYKDRKTGEIGYYNETGIIYQEWYDNFKATLKGIKDETGTLNRFGDSVLKVAMILSLAREPKLEIDPESMQSAISICEKLVGNARRVTLGKSEEGTNAIRKTTLLKELMERENHQVTRTMILKKYWILGNYNEWDECAMSLQEAGIIVIGRIGNEGVYTMTADSIKELTKFFEGRSK